MKITEVEKNELKENVEKVISALENCEELDFFFDDKYDDATEFEQNDLAIDYRKELESIIKCTPEKITVDKIHTAFADDENTLILNWFTTDKKIITQIFSEYHGYIMYNTVFYGLTKDGIENTDDIKKAVKKATKIIKIDKQDETGIRTPFYFAE